MNKPLEILLALALGCLVGLLATCHPYETAWRGAYAVRSAANMTDNALGDLALEKHRQCLAKYGAKTSGYASCVESHYKALTKWQKYALPSINSALAITVNALMIAERVKAKKLDWLGLLKPAVCMLAMVVDEWSDLLKDKAKGIKTMLAVVKGVTCG